MDETEADEIELFAPTSGPFMSFPCDLTQLVDPVNHIEFAPQLAADWVAEAVTHPKLVEPGEKRIRVAVIDSGVLTTHSWIAAFLEPGGQVDFTGEGTEDQNGHGTVTAVETIANLPAPPSLLSAKVVGWSGRADKKNMIKAFQWAKDQHVDMVVLSAGVFRRKWTGTEIDCDGTCDVCRAAADALDAGVSFIAAGGNTPGRLACPASLARAGHAGILGIGPMDENGTGVNYMDGHAFPYESHGATLTSVKAPSAEMVHAYELEEADPHAAVAQYESIMSGSDPDEAAHARERLAGLSERMGDLDRAKQLYQDVIDRDEPPAPIAAIRLGNILERGDDLAGALTAYQVAVASGHQLYAPMAAFNAGRAYHKRQILGEAEKAYRAAAGMGRSDWAAAALANLGQLLRDQGRTDEARSAFATVLAWIPNRAAHRAALDLATMEQGLGNNGAAEQAAAVAKMLEGLGAG
jgi:predicted negative regulator of RcsB-dependent stress response